MMSNQRMTDEELAGPIAEMCYNINKPLPRGPHEGVIPTNGAGIDLSPALADAIGHDGLSPVDWIFERKTA